MPESHPALPKEWGGPDPEAGRCSRCHELTVLERSACEDCGGNGSDPASSECFADDADCPSCQGRGYFDSTPCCGVDLIDPSDAVEAAYERNRETD